MVKQTMGEWGRAMQAGLEFFEKMQGTAFPFVYESDRETIGDDLPPTYFGFKAAAFDGTESLDFTELERLGWQVLNDSAMTWELVLKMPEPIIDPQSP